MYVLTVLGITITTSVAPVIRQIVPMRADKHVRNCQIDDHYGSDRHHPTLADAEVAVWQEGEGEKVAASKFSQIHRRVKSFDFEGEGSCDMA